MSYARMGKDSDVYVILTGESGEERYVCFCKPEAHSVKTAKEMIIHLDEHIKKGDKVPQHTFYSLKEETKYE